VPALRLLGQAAAGSMRDALSLTDQAIAYSASNLTEESVRGMLGTIDQRHLVRLLDALQSGQATAVLEIADELATRGLSYRAALADLAVLLSRIAIAQRVSAAVDEADPVALDIRRFATSLHPDLVQLFYTVAVHSRSELAIAPDEYAGFVMACLRMLSLGGPSGVAMPAPDTSPVVASVAPVVPVAVSVQPAPAQAPELNPEPDDEPDREPYHAPGPHVSAVTIVLPESWAAFAAKLPLSGMAEQLARQSECVAIVGQQLTLRVPSKALLEGAPTERLLTVLNDYFGFEIELLFEIGAGEGSSAHALDQVAQQARQDAAEVAIEQDPFVQALIQDFGAKVVPGSIRPNQLN
jgi:DNA polymerase-3 subunit gamma/tau